MYQYDLCNAKGDLMPLKLKNEYENNSRYMLIFHKLQGKQCDVELSAGSDLQGVSLLRVDAKSLPR